MRRIVITWMLLGIGSIPGCARGGGPLFLPDVDLRGNDPERMCAAADTDRARHACLAAHHADESDDNPAAVRKREHESAEVRETGARLTREREAAQARPASRCIVEIVGPTGGMSPSPPVQDLPERLDRVMISEGITQVNNQVMLCGDQSPAKGQVLVSVKVAAEGCVTDVTIRSTPDLVLGNCVAAAIAIATFARTQSGGSFRYPFTFSVATPSTQYDK